MCDKSGRLRSLYGEQCPFVTFVGESHLGVRFRIFLQPRPVFVLASCVEDDHIVVLGEAVYDDVVNDAAGFVEQQGILRFTVREFGDIIGRDALNEIERAGAGDAGFAHVGHVEQPGALADGGDFADGAPIGDWHVPAGKGNHGCAERFVRLVKRGSFLALFQVHSFA